MMNIDFSDPTGQHISFKCNNKILELNMNKYKSIIYIRQVNKMVYIFYIVFKFFNVFKCIKINEFDVLQHL